MKDIWQSIYLAMIDRSTLYWLSIYGASSVVNYIAKRKIPHQWATSGMALLTNSTIIEPSLSQILEISLAVLVCRRSVMNPSNCFSPTALSRIGRHLQSLAFTLSGRLKRQFDTVCLHCKVQLKPINHSARTLQPLVWGHRGPIKVTRLQANSNWLFVFAPCNWTVRVGYCVCSININVRSEWTLHLICICGSKCN